MGYNEITLPQWQQLIRRVFGLVGPGGNVPTVAPEITPVVILQPDNPEFRRLRGEKMWTVGRTNGSGVGTVGTVSIVNPLGSGTLVVIESIRAAKLGTTANTGRIVLDVQVNVEFNSPNVVAVAGFSSRDTRELGPGAGQSAAVIRTGPVAAPNVGFTMRSWIPGFIANAPPTECPELKDVVLFPGWGITVDANETGAGQTIQAQIDWFERRLESSESNAG